MVLPGSNVVTVPSVEVVVVVDSVVTGFVVVDSVVVVLVWAKAKGAIAAQARLRIVLFIIIPFIVVVESRWQAVLAAARGWLCRVSVVEELDRASGVRIQISGKKSAICCEHFSRVERAVASANVRKRCPPILPSHLNSSRSMALRRKNSSASKKFSGAIRTSRSWAFSP